MKSSYIRVLAEKIEDNHDVAMVIVIRAEGSSPRGVGSMMIVSRDGNLLAGTIGGGIVEERAKKDAADCIIRHQSKTVSYDLDKDSDRPNALNMTCGGNIEVFINVFVSRDKLLIIGGGHVGFCLYRLAKFLDYYVAIIDNRPEFCNKERFPEADELIAGDISTNLDQYPINEKTNIVIVTHGHQYDEQALEKVIESQARYIGMIGSRKKIELCFKNLQAKGISKEKLERVHAPIGLNLGGERPEEIALAIMAQINAVKYDRDKETLSF